LGAWREGEGGESVEMRPRGTGWVVVRNIGSRFGCKGVTLKTWNQQPIKEPKVACS